MGCGCGGWVDFDFDRSALILILRLIAKECHELLSGFGFLILIFYFSLIGGRK